MYCYKLMHSWNEVLIEKQHNSTYFFQFFLKCIDIFWKKSAPADKASLQTICQEIYRSTFNISSMQLILEFVFKGHWILQNGVIDGSPISLVRTHYTLTLRVWNWYRTSLNTNLTQHGHIKSISLSKLFENYWRFSCTFQSVCVSCIPRIRSNVFPMERGWQPIVPRPNGPPLNTREKVCSMEKEEMICWFPWLRWWFCIKYSFVISPDIRMSDIMRNNHWETVIVFY